MRDAEGFVRDAERDATHVQVPLGDWLRALAAGWRGVRLYLDKQFAPPQMAAMSIAVAVAYFLYQEIASPLGDEGVASAVAVVLPSAVTVILLIIQLRLLEDLDIHWSGGELLGQLGRRRPPVYRGHARIVLPDGRVVPTPRTLWAATAATTVAIVALNALLGRSAVVAALTGTGVMVLSYVALRLRRPPRIFGLLGLFDLGPACAFVYTYFAWNAHTDVALSPADVVWVAGLCWAGWEFFKFSRGIGKYDRERCFGTSAAQTCMVSAALLGLLLACQLGLWSSADLSDLYLAFVVGLTALVAVGMAATMRSLRRLGRVEGGVPRWAGLTAPAAMLAGLILALAL